MTNFFLSEWFAELLKLMNGAIGNYAITILLFTLVVKLLILPLDIKQRKSSLKTSALQGKIMDIRKRYPAKEQQQKKIQELYRKEGVSTFSSCLPSLLSLPILLALIGAVSFIANEELVRLVMSGDISTDNVQPFLWVHNMWQPDSGLAPVIPTLEQWNNLPFDQISYLQANNLVEAAKSINYETVMQPLTEAYAGYYNGWFILPLLCGGLQLLQSKLMPAPATGSPGGGKMMYYILAIMAVVICVSQSVVFTLYWTLSVVFSIVVQLILNKAIKTAPPEKEAIKIE
ncbi:MAG: membrane protein insertase YidC [Christensenellales bacterium]